MKRKSLCLFGLVLLLLGCATVEYTGRRSFIIISEEEEVALGEEAYNEVLAEAKLSQNKQESELLRRVGGRIARVADKPEYNWQFTLIDDPNTINAFALPGGKVAFYTGILPLCGGEEGVAVVMGHEVAHVIARHGAERISQGIATNLAGAALQSAVSEKTVEAQAAILQGYGLVATAGVLLPFSRKHEYEADYIGLILMAKAGYNPEAAIDFWKRMTELSKGKSIPEFLSTHPSDEKRIEAMREHLPEAMNYYRASRGNP